MNAANPGVPVSVVIPAFDAAATIERALDSVLAQTRAAAEIIVVDDASRDDTAAVIERWAARRGAVELRLIRLERNRGAASARNAGWDAAGAEYVAFLDADDAWHPAKLEIQHGWMARHPEFVLTGHACVQLRAPPLPALSRDGAVVQAAPLGAARLLLANRFSTPSAMLRRSLPHRFAEGKRYAEDYLLWLQIVLDGLGTGYIDLPLAAIFKSRYGEAGLSSHLKEMAQGELDTYRRLRGEGRIGPLAAGLLAGWSQLKFLRRRALLWASPATAPRPLAPGPHAGRSICYVVASPMTAQVFLRGHIAALAAAGHRVHVVADFPPGDISMGEAVALRLRIERRIAPVRDFAALLRLALLFRRRRFDLVHSITPKAGLLAMTAARLAGVPLRIHTFTGQVWATRRGAARAALIGIDRLIARAATQLLADSRPQRTVLIEHGIAGAGRLRVLANGSICGVDGDRFRPDAQARARLRAQLRLGEDAQLCLYLGRMNRDKGVPDLLAAFAALAARCARAHLALVGPDEEGLRSAAGAGRVHWIDYTAQPEHWFAAADIFCLPSYREGFSQTLIEAAVAGLPAVATRIYGTADTVVEGETALLHAPGDIEGLRRHLETLIGDAGLRARLAAAGRERALRQFSRQLVTDALLAFYGEVFASL